MKFYFAGRFSRRPELREYREQLIARGDEVTSRWLDLDWTHSNQGMTPDYIAANRDEANDAAAGDLEDIDDAEVFIAFNEGADLGDSRGGRFVEYGYALAQNKIIVIIGPFDNIFYALKLFSLTFDTWEDFLKFPYLREATTTEVTR